MHKPMPLTEELKLIIDRFRAAGHSANIVGGAVRNFLLGREIDDYDITTSATPAETEEIFGDFRIIETGIKHGTVTVMIHGSAFEITTYRSDGEYLDNRHPSSVSFTTSLADDLARRDFTVNAMCYNSYDGYTDLYGGLEDLRTGTIRAVGDPETRFREDALRIMRALRFASVLGFRIDEETERAIYKTKGLLKNVSPERIFVEWKKLVSGEGAYEVLSRYREVIAVVIPVTLDLRLPDRERFLAADFASRQNAIFYLSSPDAACDFDGTMRSLRTDNATRLLGYNILKAIDNVSLRSVTDVCLALHAYGYDTVLGVLELGLLLGKYGESEENSFDEAISRDLPYKISHLDLRGGDLTALGITGTEVGRLLELAIIAVIEGKCENEREALLAYIKAVL